MNSQIALLLATAVDLPDNFKKGIVYGMIAIMCCSAVYCIIKCIHGAHLLDQGEDGKKKIFSGIAMGVTPWLAVAAFKAANLEAKLGLDSALSNMAKLDPEITDVLSLAIWTVIGIAAVWCVIKCIAGAQMLEHGENGKAKIVSGLAIGLAPWVAIAALKISGIWQATGVTLTGNS